MSRLVFLEEAHRYFLDGIEIPGNTSLLQEDGIVDTTWFTPESRDRGTRVHKACWYEDEGDLDWETVRPEERGYVEAFVKFKRETGFKSDCNEFRCWSALGYATTPDILGVMETPYGLRRGLLNLKTGVASRWVGLQLAGEKIACTERIAAQDEEWARRLEYVNGHPYPELRWALELRANGTYRQITFEDPEEEAVFTGIVKKHHWKRRK